MGEHSIPLIVSINKLNSAGFLRRVDSGRIRAPAFNGISVALPWPVYFRDEERNREARGFPREMSVAPR